MLPGLNELRAKAGLAALTSPMQLFTRPDRLLVLTSEPLEYPRTDLPEHVRFVGLQPWDPPQQAPDWLAADGDPWILVTCSTDYQGDESLARAAVEALRGEPYRVLLTLSDALPGVGLESSDNIVVTRFVPHAAVLPHAAVVITHGGMGITGKAAVAGVPQVVVPVRPGPARDRPPGQRGRDRRPAAGWKAQRAAAAPGRPASARAAAPSLSGGRRAARSRPRPPVRGSGSGAAARDPAGLRGCVNPLGVGACRGRSRR